MNTARVPDEVAWITERLRKPQPIRVKTVVAMTGYSDQTIRGLDGVRLKSVSVGVEKRYTVQSVRRLLEEIGVLEGSAE